MTSSVGIFRYASDRASMREKGDPGEGGKGGVNIAFAWLNLATIPVYCISMYSLQIGLNTLRVFHAILLCTAMSFV